MESRQDMVVELRMVELSEAFSGIAPPASVLEVGAGAGWQSRELSRLGFEVEAVDIPASNFAQSRIWKVRDFDGTNLPFEDGSFDIVFTSNVLEHVEDLPALLADMARVLRTGGMMIHVVPSASWRLWTSITYYPHLVRRALLRALGTRGGGGARGGVPPQSGGKSGGGGLIARLRAPVHGNAASPFAELLEFRRSAWAQRLHLANGTLERRPTRLFYSGYQLFARHLPIRWRKRLSLVLGSSCHVFSLRTGPRGSHLEAGC